jgi:trehalose 6-phosphate phosphatase
MDKKLSCQFNTDELPSALDNFAEIKQSVFRKSSIGIFLDYDGTLTPIVSRPEDAVLSDEMQGILRWLARGCTVAIISGRGLKDVRRLVGIEDVFYAGSHGFEVAGPGGWHEEYREAAGFLPFLDQAERELRDILESLMGVQIERKRYSVAVHYRRAAAKDHETIENRAKEIQMKHIRELRISSGKCVYEIQPNIEWHKGKALDWLLKAAFVIPRDVFPLYIGDDITDEDGFRSVKDRGIGIIVRDSKRPTEASYALDGPAEVGRFLKSFADILQAIEW